MLLLAACLLAAAVTKPSRSTLDTKKGYKTKTGSTSSVTLTLTLTSAEYDSPTRSRPAMHTQQHNKPKVHPARQNGHHVALAGPGPWTRPSPSLSPLQVSCGDQERSQEEGAAAVSRCLAIIVVLLAGSPIRGADGQYHMLVSAFVGGSVHDWYRTSIIQHAVSADPLGPYVIAGTALNGTGNRSGSGLAVLSGWCGGRVAACGCERRPGTGASTGVVQIRAGSQHSPFFCTKMVNP